MDVQTILIFVLSSLVMGWFFAAVVFSALCKNILKRIDRTGHFEIGNRLFAVREIVKSDNPL